MVNISPGGALVITRFESSYSIFANHDYTRLTADFLEGRAGQCLHIRALEVCRLSLLVLWLLVDSMLLSAGTC